MNMVSNALRWTLDRSINLRTKDFLSSNFHFVLHISKDGWFNEVTFVSESATAAHDLSTLLLSGVNEAKHTFKLNIINQWPLLHPRVEGVSKLSSFSSLDHLLHKLIVNA